MRYWLLGAAITLVVVGTATGISYAVLNYFYGERTITTTAQTMVIENSGQRITIDNVSYEIENVEFLFGSNENYYQLWYENYGGDFAAAAPASLSVPAEAYEQAQTTGEPVTISNVTTTEIKPINPLPIAASIGIAVGLVAFAAWIGYRRAWGDATSTLLEHGLHDMTVRDIEIVGYIMEQGKFTIPELMKQTKASKITVWRTVKKLVEQGLVRPTEETKSAANGLGGRGKPSCVYEYVGEKGVKSET